MGQQQLNSDLANAHALLRPMGKYVKTRLNIISVGTYLKAFLVLAASMSVRHFSTRALTSGSARRLSPTTAETMDGRSRQSLESASL
jgi:hypothetical protein